MCKKIIIATIVSICLVFTGCSTGQPKEEKQINVKETGRQKKNNTKADNTLKEKENTKNNNLQLLCKESMRFMSEAGYYYITEDSKELKGELWGRHIMYMDFATKQEVYLCAEPGCKHNDKKCTAVLPEGEFGERCLIFTWNNTLYIVSKSYEMENTVTTDYLWDENGENSGVKGVDISTEVPSVLYSMGLDGTNRTKEYVFEQGVKLDDVVLCDENNIYFATKKINTYSNKENTFYTASNQELVKYQTKDSKLEKVCSLEFEDDIRWYIEGCHDSNVILRGRKYNKNLSREEEIKLDKEESWKYLNDSKIVYAGLDLAQGSIKEIYSLKNDPNSDNSTIILDDYLYVSKEKTGEIEKVNIETGNIQKLAKLKQGYISGTLSDKLYCTSWNGKEDHTIYFVDVNSGKTEHCTLVNHCNGWDLEIIGETGNQVLAIYDYDAEKGEEEGGYDIKRKQYGLIDKKDLYQSKDRFEKIKMKGAGE